MNVKVGMRKLLKNQTYDVIKMNDYPSLFYGFSFPLLLLSPSFLRRHMADFLDTLSRYITTSGTFIKS